jgi:ATP phosphoribosyltransferase
MVLSPRSPTPSSAWTRFPPRCGGNVPSAIRLAVPSASSRLHDAAVSTVRRALAGADLGAGGGRLLWHSLPDGLQLVQCRGTDIPMLVASGVVDVGLTGYDVTVERAIATGDQLDVRSLAPARASLVCLVSPPGRRRIKLLYTEYPNLTRSWTRSTLAFQNVQIVHLHGSIEGLVSLDPQSGGVVLVTTGETLRANGLVVEVPIMATDLCVVRRDTTVSAIGSLAIDRLPSLAMPRFVRSAATV